MSSRKAASFTIRLAEYAFVLEQYILRGKIPAFSLEVLQRCLTEYNQLGCTKVVKGDVWVNIRYISLRPSRATE